MAASETSKRERMKDGEEEICRLMITPARLSVGSSDYAPIGVDADRRKYNLDRSCLVAIALSRTNCL
jgi:hypothetical protein